MLTTGAFEQNLREIKENFFGLLEAAPEPIVIYDTQMSAVYINPAFTETFGWSLDDLLGKRLVPEERRSEADDMVRRILKGEKVKSFEIQGLAKDGKTLDVWMSATLFHDKLGSPVGVVVGLRDITDRKRAAEERMKREKLQGVLEMAGAACHELNQPLQAAYILLEGLLEETQTSNAKKLKEQLNNIRAIIRKVENITVYKTMDYIKGERIVDIDKASGGA
jgi:PAS domain S-box-containing protein